MIGQGGGMQTFNAPDQQHTTLQPHPHQRSQLFQDPQQYGPMHIPVDENGMPRLDALYQQHSAPQLYFQHQPQPVQNYQYIGQSQFTGPEAFMQQYGYPSQQSGFDHLQDVPQQQHVQGYGTFNQVDSALGYNFSQNFDLDISSLFPELFNGPSWQGDVEP